MSSPEAKPTDAAQRLTLIGTILTIIGASVAALFIAAGTALHLNQPRGGAVLPPTSLPEIWQGAAGLEAPAVISLGLLVLVATPAVRVVTILLQCLWDGDKTFALICLSVLGLLALGAVLA